VCPYSIIRFFLVCIFFFSCNSFVTVINLFPFQFSVFIYIGFGLLVCEWYALVGRPDYSDILGIVFYGWRCWECVFCVWIAGCEDYMNLLAQFFSTTLKICFYSTPGSVYTGVDFCKKLCGVSIVRRWGLNQLLTLVVLVIWLWRLAPGMCWQTSCYLAAGSSN
jgi:hypothetical protein